MTFSSVNLLPVAPHFCQKRFRPKKAPCKDAVRLMRFSESRHSEMTDVGLAACVAMLRFAGACALVFDDTTKRFVMRGFNALK